MSRKESQVTVRLPAKLADALSQRAEKKNEPMAEVARDAIAREVARPVDPREPSFADAWLRGATAEMEWGEGAWGEAAWAKPSEGDAQ